VLFDSDGIMTGAIEHSRNLAGTAHAACGVLVEFALAGLCYDYFRHLLFVSFR
jgi:hypothetical protein